MPTACVNGTDIYYEEHGSGLPLVFVYGLGVTHAMWEPQVETFSRTRRVITLDVCGTGGSGRLTGWRDILKRQVSDLAALLDYLDIEKIALCGVSYGGAFVQRFVLDYPERCAALIIVDSFSDTRPHDLKMMGLMLGRYLLARLLIAQAMAGIRHKAAVRSLATGAEVHRAGRAPDARLGNYEDAPGDQRDQLHPQTGLHHLPDPRHRGRLLAARGALDAKDYR